jgi:hypothetical protein
LNFGVSSSSFESSSTMTLVECPESILSLRRPALESVFMHWRSDYNSDDELRWRHVWSFSTAAIDCSILIRNRIHRRFVSGTREKSRVGIDKTIFIGNLIIELSEGGAILCNIRRIKIKSQYVTTIGLLPEFPIIDEQADNERTPIDHL